MSKYIIDVGEGYIRHGLERTLTIPVRINEHEDHWMDTRIPVTPYTEPDLDAIRNEAYEKGVQDTKQHWVDAPRSCAYKLGYENGLNDAWEAARKIVLSRDDGGIEYEAKKEIFGHTNYNIIREFTVSEAIEKIRRYEQKQEIQVGNEIKCDNERYVVLQKYLNNIDEPMAVLFNRRDGKISVFHLYNGNGAIFEKTGKHFPELVELLRKMKES